MFGVVNAPNVPSAAVSAPNSGDLRVVLSVNGVEEWRGSFAEFLLDNTFAPAAVKEMAHNLSAGTPHEFGGGAEPTFRLERETSEHKVEDIRASLTAQERLQLIDRVMRAVFDATESLALIGEQLAFWTWAVTDNDPDNAWVDWSIGEPGSSIDAALNLFVDLFPPTESYNASVWAFILRPDGNNEGGAS